MIVLFVLYYDVVTYLLVGAGFILGGFIFSIAKHYNGLLRATNVLKLINN